MTDNSIVAYCMSCKTKQTMQDPQPVYTKRGQPGTRGKCSVCGANMFRMGETPAHAGIPKPDLPKKDGKLVIVESPTKVRTLGRILDRTYEIEASMGHVRDLPKSKLGVDVENGFEPHYQTIRGKGKVLKGLRRAVKKAGEIYLATDPDREGEAIAWHLCHAARIPEGKTRRVSFHELTPPTVEAAFARPRQIDMDLVNAQQARRILDRLVGYKISPLLWKKVKGGLSAGRVQSVALKMIVEREREIAAFVPDEYWTIEAELAKREKEARSFIAKLIEIGGEKAELQSEKETQQAVADLEDAAYEVAKVKRRKRRRHSRPPFKTSTLQRKAGSTLHFSPKKTMFVAQQLYEGIELGDEGEVGLITYMRTDSLHVAPAAQKEARGYIAKEHGDKFLPDKAPRYSSKKSQEGHEAIRATSVWRTPAKIKRYLDKSQYRLYQLIWKRFVASQMASAVLDKTVALIRADTDYVFKAKGEKVIFPGFLVIYPKALKKQKEKQILPLLSKGDLLDLIELLPEQHFTQPPHHFNESSLVEAMEKAGVGRPSTYAPTISVLKRRYYVEKENRHLVPTELGFTVCDLLVEHFPKIMDVDFTAGMEEQLDRIATGDMAWVDMLHRFWGPFEKTLDAAKANMQKVTVAQPTGEKCPECGGELMVRWGRYGKFIGCSNFPDCEFTRPYLEKIGVKCPECGGDLVEKRTRKRNRIFYGCANYPECEFATWKRPLPQPCPHCDGLLTAAGKDRAKCVQCGELVGLEELEGIEEEEEER